MPHYNICISFHVIFPHQCPADILKSLYFWYGFSVLQLILEFVSKPGRLLKGYTCKRRFMLLFIYVFLMNSVFCCSFAAPLYLIQYQNVLFNVLLSKSMCINLMDINLVTFNFCFISDWIKNPICVNFWFARTLSR